jgi:hypothetical protein
VFQLINKLEKMPCVILRELRYCHQSVTIKNMRVTPVCTVDVCVFVFVYFHSDDVEITKRRPYYSDSFCHSFWNNLDSPLEGIE